MAKLIGMDPDDLKVLFCILFHVPMSYTFRHIPSKTQSQIMARKLVGLFLGLSSCAMCFNFLGLIGFALVSVVSYYLSLRCTDRRTTFILCLLSFAWCCLANIIKLMNNYQNNNINITVVYLIITPKIIYFNWHVNSLFLNKETHKIPTLIDYFSFLFNFIGILTGPIYSYPEFEAFITQKYPEKQINWLKIMNAGLETLFSFVIYVYFLNYFDLTLLIREEFSQKNIVYRMAHIIVEASLLRIKFTIAWKITYIQVILANLRSSDNSFEGYLETVDSRVVYFGMSSKMIIEKWNMSIQRWLKNCFYLPATEIYNLCPHRASQLTFVISAFWHGFYPTYYASFLSWNFLSETEKMVYKCPPLRRFFPMIYYRFILDVNGCLFMRHMGRDYLAAFKNVKYLFFANFIVYGIVKVITSVIKVERKKSLHKIEEVIEEQGNKQKID